MEENSFVPKGLLPAYLAEVFGQLYEEDGLVVLGKGLQSDMLLASLIRYYADFEEGHYAEEEEKKKRKDGKPPLVIVLGLHRDSERTTLLDVLTSWGTPPEMMPTVLTNEAGQSKERAALYQQGGVFVITSRILIVDLLTATIDSMQIDGLLVAHAEQVTETSTEAFIIRIIQSQRQFQAPKSSNSTAFVKAISEAPEQVMAGFSKVDKILKALHVQRLYLYPRFHDSIREELEGRNPPKVVELHQELSPLQKEMQQAIAVALQSVIRKLKESKALANLTLLLDGEQFTVENLVTNPLDQALSRNLEHDWHRLSPETKQLIQDLRTLRTLFQNLLTYDCVSFYKLLQSIQSMSAASRHPSMWLLTPAADVLFRKAKERLFTLHRPLPTKQVPNPVLKCQPVLEESPKWRLLRTILSEIREKFENEQLSSDKMAGPTNILILVKDDRTLAAVKDYLVQGNRALLFRWLRFLEQQNDRSRSITVNGGVETLSEESRVLLEEESRCRRILFGDQSKRKRRLNVPINHVPEFVRKRRRIVKEKARGEATMQTADIERNAVLDEAVDLAEHDLNDVGMDLSPFYSQDDQLSVSFPNELRVVLKSYASVDQASLLLQDLNPRYVLFYDTDITFVRAVEIHAALSDIQIEVYFLMFQASAEDKIFMKSLEREQNTFERLINHKKMMSPPALHCATTTQEMQHAMARGSLGGTYMGGTLPLAVDTRKGRKANEEKRDIAVDVREFRSVLPSILHQGGMRLAPVTLIVGDFVLSSVHCVERKSISDLFGSFASGRLYTQVESMVKYYKVPCLLIEFDPAKSFSLQNASELGVEIRTDSVCSKICLLTMHFPQLRILWSKSPHDTLKIFKDLKRNHDEVDVERAMEIGRNELEDSLFETSSESDELNEVARDMLLRLPGVNIHSARKIMQNCDCLAELCDMSRDELRRVAGPVTGQKLFTFFRQKISPANV